MGARTKGGGGGGGGQLPLDFRKPGCGMPNQRHDSSAGCGVEVGGVHPILPFEPSRDSTHQRHSPEDEACTGAPKTAVTAHFQRGLKGWHICGRITKLGLDEGSGERQYGPRFILQLLRITRGRLTSPCEEHLAHGALMTTSKRFRGWPAGVELSVWGVLFRVNSM